MREKIAVTLPPNAPPITQQFYRFTRDGRPGHVGLDLTAPLGTPIVAAASGRVLRAWVEPMYGNRIVIDHGIGPDGRRSFTQYEHLRSLGVATGARVRQGQEIGTLGESGLLSSYPHLHFDVLRESAPGARPAGAGNWWQGMTPEDPNRFWAGGVGHPVCAGEATGGAGVLPLVYPVRCR